MSAVPNDRPRSAEIVVMTFNILYRNRSHHGTVASIVREMPDVVALQELSSSAAQYVASRLGAVLPHQALHPRTGGSGGGVLSRFPILEETTFSLGSDGHVCQHLELDVPGRPIGFINVHLSAPKLLLRYDKTKRDREAAALAVRVEQVGGPLIVVGDFNMTPSSLGYLLLTARLRDAYGQAGAAAGRTFPHAPRIGRVPIPLWPAPFPVIRIDYVFHSYDLVARRSRLGDGDGSDHRPVIAELDFAL